MILSEQNYLKYRRTALASDYGRFFPSVMKLPEQNSGVRREMQEHKGHEGDTKGHKGFFI
jgi:hypothetical protein